MKYELLKNRSILKLAGSDAKKFLQSVTTNDVVKNKFSYNFWLNNQGRYLFDFFVLQDQDDYLIDIEKTCAEAFIKRVRMFKLRSKFTVEDVSDEYLIYYSERKEIFNKGGIAQAISQQDPRSDKLGFRILAKQLEKEGGDPALQVQISEAAEAYPGLYLQHKYNYGIVDGSSDMIYEKSIPIEYGAEQLNAISYDKGCYVGQEVISRAKYQGEIRKKIHIIEFEKDFTPEQSSPVNDSDGNKIGVICSSYQNRAIALLRIEKVKNMNSSNVLVCKQSAVIL